MCSPPPEVRSHRLASGFGNGARASSDVQCWSRTWLPLRKATYARPRGPIDDVSAVHEASQVPLHPLRRVHPSRILIALSSIGT